MASPDKHASDLLIGRIGLIFNARNNYTFTSNDLMCRYPVVVATDLFRLAGV